MLSRAVFSAYATRTASVARTAMAARHIATKMDNINQKLVQAQYAVRGELVLKALQYQSLLQSKAPQDQDAKKKLPFEQVIFCNIGNPQELGQLPITFFRQVLALCVCPSLLDDPVLRKAFPEDVVARAQQYLATIPGGTGAYSNSQGVTVVREEVAKFISERDGYPANPDDIFLTDGASSAVKMVLQTLIRDERDGILTPIPQYPLYSATITLQGGTLIPYMLNEEANWSTTKESLTAALQKAQANNQGLLPRALVVINPGNPTGSMLDYENLKQIVLFCKENKLMLMADEVYQTNVWNEKQKPFVSFKKVLRDLGKQAEGVELVSFHSVSKGFVGECGRRGGYMELVNIDPDVKMQLYKLASISLCSNVEGQLMVGLMTNPPKKGDPSFATYEAERTGILSSLQRRAEKLATVMNKLPGISCAPIEGALYLFPRVRLPAKAIAEAKKQGKHPDVYYCLEALAHTGIVIVPGSGFQQEEGTFHFRTTILPGESKIDAVTERFSKFHNDFMKRFA